MLYQIIIETGAILFNRSNRNSMQNPFPNWVPNEEFSKNISE